MFWTLAVLFLIAWVLGIFGTFNIGILVHTLLVVAIVLFVVGTFDWRLQNVPDDLD